MRGLSRWGGEVVRIAKEYAKEFYRSHAWRTARAEALRRDTYTCHDCDGRATDVHHIVELTPANINNRRIAFDLHNLMSLCHDCHTARTKGAGDLPEGFTFDAFGQPIPPGG